MSVGARSTVWDTPETRGPVKVFDQGAWEWKEVKAPVAVPPRERAGWTALIPFAVAAAFIVFGRVVLGSVVAAIGLVLLLLQFAAPSAHASILAMLAALGKWVGKVFGFAGLSVVYGLVFTPAAVVARLIRRDPLALQKLPATRSYWVDVPTVDHRRLAERPFLLESARGRDVAASGKTLRIARGLYHAALTLFVLNLGLGWISRDLLGYSDTVKQRERGERDPRSQLAVYRNDPWAKGYFKELAESTVLAYRPFVGWARKDYQGQYINVADGHRKTYRAQMGGTPSIRMYAFGASAMWGIGARDDHTIPSYLVKLAEEDGIHVEAENFAENAFVNWQNVLRLSELCAAGQCPDVAVFYEGAGDAGAKIQTPEMQRVHENFGDWKQWIEDHDNVERWFDDRSLIHIVARALGSGRQKRELRQTILSTEPQRVAQMANELVTTYEQNATFVRKMADAYGFKAYFYWQPVIYTRKAPTEEERGFHRVFGAMMPELYRAATKEVRARDFALDLSTSFDDRDGPIYIDWAHLGEPGNEIVARNMYRQLRPALQSAATAKKARRG